jgi:hypothetical protein
MFGCGESLGKENERKEGILNRVVFVGLVLNSVKLGGSFFNSCIFSETKRRESEDMYIL